MVKCKVIGDGKYILVLTGWARACLIGCKFVIENIWHARAEISSQNMKGWGVCDVQLLLWVLTKNIHAKKVCWGPGLCSFMALDPQYPRPTYSLWLAFGNWHQH